MSANFIEPKKKKYYKRNTNLPLPVFQISENEIEKFNGIFNGLSVTIENNDEMVKVYLNGYFGKGNLSRSYPNFANKNVIRKRQMDNRNEWAKKSSSTTIENVIVVTDSDSDNDDYFKNIQPHYQIDKSHLKEELHLSIEEAYFLFDAIKCLNIIYNHVLLDSQTAWTLFSNADQYFIQNYVTYYYFRSKNWIVKSGLKFGGDYLLYKEGPPFYHASYIVIIDVIDQETKERKKDACRRSMELPNIIGLHRLCETAGKELMVCELIWPNTPINEVADIKQITIKEILVKRWLLPNELGNNE